MRDKHTLCQQLSRVCGPHTSFLLAFPPHSSRLPLSFFFLSPSLLSSPASSFSPQTLQSPLSSYLLPLMVPLSRLPYSLSGSLLQLHNAPCTHMYTYTNFHFNVSLRDILFKLTISSSGHLSTDVTTAFSFMAEENPFFIHSYRDGHLGCFYFRAVVNTAATNADKQVFLRQDVESSRCVPRHDTAGSYGSHICNIFLFDFYLFMNKIKFQISHVSS